MAKSDRRRRDGHAGLFRLLALRHFACNDRSFARGPRVIFAAAPAQPWSLKMRSIMGMRYGGGEMR